MAYAHGQEGEVALNMEEAYGYQSGICGGDWNIKA